MSIFGTPQFQLRASAGAAPAVNTAAGDLLVVAVAGNTSTTGFTLADTAGNTFIGVGSVFNSSFNRIQMFYCIGAKANAANAVTPTPQGAGSAMQGIAVWDFPISGGSAPVFDTSASGQATSGTWATSAFNTAGSDELVVCAVANAAGNQGTQQAGFALDANGTVNHNWSSIGAGCAEHGLLTSPQTGFVAQMTGGSTGFGALALAFMAPAAAGGGNAPVVVIM